MQPVVTSPETDNRRPSRLQRLRDLSHYNPVMYSLVGLVLLCVIMAFLSGEFLSLANLSNVLRQVSINAVIAVGMTVVILTGGIDLSVGAVMALGMTVAAGAMLAGVPVYLAISMALLTGLFCGAINGVLVAYLRLPAIIVTLAWITTEGTAANRA